MNRNISAEPEPKEDVAALDVQRHTTNSESSVQAEILNLRVYLAASGPMLGWIAQQEMQTLCATILTMINADIGPITNYPWIFVSWLLCVAILSGIFGSFSDQLGKRWFFIMGNIFALVGAIICATANSANVVIVGMTFAGVGAANQYLALAALSEIFPNKDRAYVQGTIQLFPFPFIACGSLIAFSMADLTWRWVYYLNIILSGLSLVAVILFYNPPLPHKGTSAWQLIKKGDWLGVTLFILGLMGIGMGVGPAAFGIYGWGTTSVLVPICIGILLLIGMGLWNAYGASNPLQPLVLFRNFRGIVLLLLVVAAISMPLEVLMFVWSSQAQSIYTTDSTKIGLYNFPTGCGSEVGAFMAALFIRRIRRTNLQLAAACLVLAIFIGLQATLAPNSVTPALAYLSIGGFALGYIQVITVIMIQLGAPDKHIGAATGLFIVCRWIGAAIGISIALTIIRSKVSSTWPGAVAEVVLPLGLPQTSLPTLLGALATGDPTMITQVPGITPAIIGAAIVATKDTFAAAYQIIYYPSLALGLLATILALFTNDVTSLMTTHLAVCISRPQVDIVEEHYNTTEEDFDLGDAKVGLNNQAKEIIKI